MRSLHAAVAVVSLAAALLLGCGGDDGGGDERAAAASLCARLQGWIDGIERSSKELSDRTLPEPDAAARKRHFESWVDDVIGQTRRMRADVAALDLGAPLTGIDEALGLLEGTREEIAGFPEQDPESLGYRIARVFLSTEAGFAKVRTWTERLGEAAESDVLGEALVEEPACVDYDDPLT